MAHKAGLLLPTHTAGLLLGLSHCSTLARVVIKEGGELKLFGPRGISELVCRGGGLTALLLVLVPCPTEQCSSFASPRPDLHHRDPFSAPIFDSLLSCRGQDGTKLEIPGVRSLYMHLIMVLGTLFGALSSELLKDHWCLLGRLQPAATQSERMNETWGLQTLR
ncbi:hypothetical protein C8R45DRAFT_1070372 [Mycena sanguinolenta]|nr:hypothetical protein C8R45DRAFT_1070372 [Mycena sanguinolenta]